MRHVALILLAALVALAPPVGASADDGGPASISAPATASEPRAGVPTVDLSRYRADGTRPQTE